MQVVTGSKKTQATPDPVELQQQLMRFADDFSGRTVSAADKLRRGTNALDRLEMQELKLGLLNETVAVATGPNALANLLDMVVLVSLSRISLEEYWSPQIYGESARPMLEACRRGEVGIWRVAANVLKPEQQEELRKAISAWGGDRSDWRAVLSTRAVGLAVQVGKGVQETPSSGGTVFSLLMLDPLAGLDPATRELAQTRLVAERALFLSQRLPLLLRWQTEVLGQHLACLPEVQQALTNTTQLAASAERLSRVAEQVPGHVSAERKELVAALDAQAGKLSGLAAELRQALVAGEQMSASLNATLLTFDALMKRFGVGEPKSSEPQDTNSRPFDVLDYSRTAKEVAAMAQQLDTTLQSFNGALDSPAWNQRLQDFKGLSAQAREDTRSILNHAFLVGAGLILLIFGSALLYRLLTARLTRANRPAA